MSQLIYVLASRPVKDVKIVAAKVKRSWTTGNGITVTRGLSEDFDDLFSSTQVLPAIHPTSAQTGIAIYQILRISNTAGGAANYVEGVDWELSGNSILWVSGTRPGPGQAYYVDLILIRALAKGRRVRTLKVNEVVNHATVDGDDNLANKDLIRVLRVAAGPDDSDPAYVEGVDYVVGSGRNDSVKDYIKIYWYPTGGGTNEPPPGSNYYVTYEYWRHVLGHEGDYTSIDSYYDEDDTTPASQYLRYQYSDLDALIPDSVDFRVVGGDRPVQGSDVNVQYDFYVPRRDVISLTASGEFIIHRGVPGRNPVYPGVGITTMEIAKLDIPANSANVLVNYPETRRLTVADLRQIRDMIDTQTYNSAVRYLESLAMFEHTNTSKKMVLVDPYIDFSRINFLYNISGLTNRCSVDPENGSLMLPQIYGSRKLVVESMTNIEKDPLTGQSVFDSVAMASFDEDDLISQTFATERLILNPQSNLGPIATISITPSQTFWPDPTPTPDCRLESRTDSLLPVTQDDLRVESRRLTRVFGFVRRAWNRWWVGGSKTVPWGGTGQLNQITNIYYPQFVPANYPSDEFVGSRSMDRINDKILDRSVTPIMQQQVITVTSDNWVPFANNIEIYFDGVRMLCTPTDPAFTGTLLGSLRSSSTGAWSGTFTIPPGSRTGRKEIRAVSAVPNTESEFVSASAIFAAEGLRQIQNTSYVTLDVIGTSESSGLDVVNVPHRAESGAQIITANRDAPITGAILYFATRPTPGGANDRPISVQIRDLDSNGQPTSSILAHKTVQSIEVNPSLDSSAETLVEFDDPVFITAGQSYALVLSTDSAEYTVFLSRLGSRDFLTGQLVLKNPNMGTFWRSEGGLAYTPDPYADLKCKIRYAVFRPDTTAALVFQNITNMASDQVLRDSQDNVNIPAVPTSSASLPNHYTKFLHVVSYYAPSGSRVIWSYSVNGGVTWTPYTPGVEVDMGGAQTQIQIKCDMDMQQITGTTPGSGFVPSAVAVNLLHNGLVLIGQEATGSAMTHSTNLLQPASTLRVIFQTDVPLANAGTQKTVKVFYSVDGGFVWSSLDDATVPSERALLTPLLERRYDVALPPFIRLAIRIDMKNDSEFNSDPQVRALRVIAY